MTNQELPHVSILGRPFKPVALGLALNVAVIAQANFRAGDRGVEGGLAILLALASGIAFACLVAGWAAKRQALAQDGLLITAGVYITRAVFVAIESPWDQAIFFSIGGAIIAGGSYLLEATDPRGHRV